MGIHILHNLQEVCSTVWTWHREDEEIWREHQIHVAACCGAQSVNPTPFDLWAQIGFQPAEEVPSAALYYQIP